jgi:hypothetical protein
MVVAETALLYSVSVSRAVLRMSGDESPGWLMACVTAKPMVNAASMGNIPSHAIALAVGL